MDESDSGEVRIQKICRLIRSCRYGIHDLSRVELSGNTKLPRFNMPFELGIDFGAKHLGGTATRNKKLLILERDKYRYLALISDIAGQDIQEHSNDPDKAITVVRHWLRTVSRRATIPAAPEIKRRFIEFTSALPKLARDSGADPSDLQFVEYVKLAEVWLTTNPPKSV